MATDLFRGMELEKTDVWTVEVKVGQLVMFQIWMVALRKEFFGTSTTPYCAAHSKAWGRGFLDYI